VRKLAACAITPSEGSMKRILICEDELDTRESLRNILGRSDYEVFSAIDGKESIESARKFTPDLVLLDIRMPKLDGLEVAREIRKFNAKAKIIFITAFSGEELAREAKKYDILDFIVKPVSTQHILDVVQRCL
jgi:CheY-like chemotaxis protein